jgi:hypothetical protein
MHLTKPAGVFFQLVGAFLVLVGLVSLSESIFWGAIVLAIGGWMVWQGRQPSMRTNSVEAVKEPDRVENLITAKGGQFTYRVMAYRKMEKGEVERAVLEALKSGDLKEPEPGGIATLVTDIGR